MTKDKKMNQKITITDRFLYQLIKSYNLNGKPFFASNEYIAKELNVSKSTVSHSISRLLDMGYIANKGNKMVRELYTKRDLLSADSCKESADSCIFLDDFKREFAKNSNNKMLKSAIESADSCNILIKILISYTNIIGMQCLDEENNNIKKIDATALENNLKNIYARDVVYDISDKEENKKSPVHSSNKYKNPPTPLKIEWEVIHLTYADFDKWFEVSGFKEKYEFIDWLNDREHWLEKQSDSIKKNWFFSTSKEISKIRGKNDK